MSALDYFRTYAEVLGGTRIDVATPDQAVGDAYVVSIRAESADRGGINLYFPSAADLRRLRDQIDAALPENAPLQPDKSYAVIVPAGDSGDVEVRIENHDGPTPVVVARAQMNPDRAISVDNVAGAVREQGWAPRNLHWAGNRIIGVAFPPGSKHSDDTPTEQFGTIIPVSGR